MATHGISQQVLIGEFLDEIRQRADARFKGHTDQAFLDWYIEAEFGRPSWKFTDGPYDGGIDAVVWRPDDEPPVAIIQSKFTEKIGRSALSRNAYDDFREVVDAFHIGEEDFDEFLSGVREDLKKTFRKAYDTLTARERMDWRIEKKAFRLVTTHKKRRKAEFDRIPPENFVYSKGVLSLYRQYRRGATPVARSLELAVEDKLYYRDEDRGVASYLFNARLSDFRKYLEKNDVARLVARNIRYNLAGKLGRDIRRTFEKDAGNFWYVHNGLTIVCDAFVEKDQVATLYNPSVVNGAQTLYAISGSSRKKSKALVTTRVIVRGTESKQAIEDDGWVQKVIRGVNTQNRVQPYDLRSNEPEQIELQRKFRDQRVFFERKRGEWREFRNDPKYRGFDRISLKYLGQALTAVSEKSGDGVDLIKHGGAEEIFGDRHYRKVFPSRSRVARRFERIYLAYRIYRLLKKVKLPSQKMQKRQKLAFWHALWITHLGITSVARFHTQATVRGIRDAFDEFEDGGMWGRRAKKVVKEVRKSIWSAWQKGRKKDPEHWTPENFFKTKFGNKTVLRLAFPQVRKGLKSLAERIVEKS